MREDVSNRPFLASLCLKQTPDQSIAHDGKFGGQRDQRIDGRSQSGFVVMGELGDQLGNLTIVHVGGPRFVAPPSFA